MYTVKIHIVYTYYPLFKKQPHNYILQEFKFLKNNQKVLCIIPKNEYFTVHYYLLLNILLVITIRYKNSRLMGTGYNGKNLLRAVASIK